jgi:hypothetical protein
MASWFSDSKIYGTVVIRIRKFRSVIRTLFHKMPYIFRLSPIMSLMIGALREIPPMHSQIASTGTCYTQG